MTSYCAFLVVITFLISPVISTNISWCTQTPHPEPCESYLTNNPKYHFPILEKSDFLKASLHLALDHAVTAQKSARALLASKSKRHSEKEKAAWADCLELLDSTIAKLNQTVDTNIRNWKRADAQTCLSAALTNLQTCKEGFSDLGVTADKYLMPNNDVLGDLISNTLALNKGYDYGTGIFMTWLPIRDRNMLLVEAQINEEWDIMVAKDGSGNYKTVKEAVAEASKRRGNRRFVIYVKEGIYNENVEIRSEKVMLVGDGIGKTIMTGSRSVGGGFTTFNSATVAVKGDGFIARGITFRNTAGPQNHQAVALLSDSDRSVFYRCSFEGYQDTLYVRYNRQFYRECDIYGTVDIIFGNAAAMIQKCNIYARNPPNKINTITAQGRSNPNQTTGISIHESRVTAASELRPIQSLVKTYLGRPWEKYSRTVFMKTFLDSLIDPAGWTPWKGNLGLESLYYGEYMNTGAGSSIEKRVKWPGYHAITSTVEASNFAAGKFISGDSWVPPTGVPYTSSLCFRKKGRSISNYLPIILCPAINFLLS